jgi:hypothetical protein
MENILISFILVIILIPFHKLPIVTGFGVVEVIDTKVEFGIGEFLV